MASIRRVVHRTGGMSWQARWRDPTGSQRSKNFPRRVDAERFLVTIEARKLAGTYIDPRAGRIRLGDFTEQATAGWVNRRDSTKARDESYLRSLVMPVFAEMPIGAITLFDVQVWITDLVADGYAPATIRHTYQLLGRICNDAVTAGLIARTPCRDVNLPKIQDTEKRFLSPTEITRLANTIDHRYKALVITAAYTGCRVGELIAEGAHPAVIASRLGHTSVKTVLDVYEGLDRNAADTLNPPWDPSDVDAMWTRRTRNTDQGRRLT